MTREEKTEQWRRVVSGHAESGLSIKAFCGKHAVPEWQFHYWKRRFRDIADDGGFVQLSCGGGTGVRICHKGYDIFVERDFDARTLKRVLQSL